MKPQSKSKTERRSPNIPLSAEDLKKIRGGVAALGAPPIRSAAEKDDEDFAAIHSFP